MVPGRAEPETLKRRAWTVDAGTQIVCSDVEGEVKSYFYWGVLAFKACPFGYEFENIWNLTGWPVSQLSPSKAVLVSSVALLTLGPPLVKNWVTFYGN